MATNSKSNTEPLLLTGCLIIIWSTERGMNRHAPALQGSGFPRHEPSLNPTAVSVWQLSIRHSISSLETFPVLQFLYLMNLASDNILLVG